MRDVGEVKVVTHFPFFGIMFLIFLTLKLCGVIGWSWWWVTAPLWGPIVFVVSLILIFFLVACIIQAANK